MKLVALDRDYILGGEATPDEAKEIAMRCNAYDALLARNKELEDALMGLAARCEESELLTATEPYFKAKGVLAKLKTPTDGK